MDTSARELIGCLGKGQRDRVVPLTETTSHWLTGYLTTARPDLAAGRWWGKSRRRGQPKPTSPTSALWLSVTGRRLSYQMIAERTHDYACRLNLKPRCTPSATVTPPIFLRGGASVRHVQQFLGHRDLNTTVYTHIEIEDLKQAIESADCPKVIE